MSNELPEIFLRSMNDLPDENKNVIAVRGRPASHHTVKNNFVIARVSRGSWQNSNMKLAVYNFKGWFDPLEYMSKEIRNDAFSSLSNPTFTESEILDKAFHLINIYGAYGSIPNGFVNHLVGELKADKLNKKKALDELTQLAQENGEYE